MTTNMEFTARCKAFGQMATNRIQVSLTDHAVRVWDSVAGHYTRCHGLSDGTTQRLLRRGLEMAGEKKW